MAIYLTEVMAGQFRTQFRSMEDAGPGSTAEQGRYTAKIDPDGTSFTVWAWVQNEARKIGTAALS